MTVLLHVSSGHSKTHRTHFHWQQTTPLTWLRNDGLDNISIVEPPGIRWLWDCRDIWVLMAERQKASVWDWRHLFENQSEKETTTLAGFVVSKVFVTRLMRWAKHQREWIMTVVASLSWQWFWTRALKFFAIPLFFPTMLVAPSVETETILLKFAFLSFSQLNIKDAKSFPVESVHWVMKSGASITSSWKENLPMQAMKCVKWNSEVSIMMEKNWHSSRYLLHRACFLCSSLRDCHLHELLLAKILLETSSLSGEMNTIAFFQKRTSLLFRFF